MVRITGRKEHSARLKRMTSPEAKAAIYKGLFAAGNLIEVEAEIMITEGSVSGKNHVPSKPGEPPNADTRLLDGSIETTGDKSVPRVTVTSNAPYGAALELGTAKMIERPYMRPATARKRGEAIDLVRRANNAVIRGQKGS